MSIDHECEKCARKVNTGSKSHVITRVEFKEAVINMMGVCGQAQLLEVLSEIVAEDQKRRLECKTRGEYNDS